MNWKVEKVESVMFTFPSPEMYENTIQKLQSKLLNSAMSSNKQVNLLV